MSVALRRIWILDRTWDYARWSASIVKKLATIVPGYTVLVAASSLVSQVAQLLAFILPLKIVLLMGSSGVPSYFPAVLTGFDKNTLALGLGLTAAACYLIYLVGNAVVDRGSASGARLVLERARKLALFDDQDRIALRAYQRFATTYAALAFAMLGLGAIAFIYPQLYLFLLGVLSGYALIVALVGQRETGRTWLATRASTLTEVLAAVFFLSTAGFIVMDFVLAQGVNLIVAIAAIILARQIAQRLSTLVNDAVLLSQQQVMINALFFHSKLLERPLAEDRQQPYWSLLEPARRDVWLSSLLEDIMGERPASLDVCWHRTALKGITGFRVAAGGREFFVKVFDTRQQAQAQHESALLSDPVAQLLPAPQLISVASVDDYRCLLFEAVPEDRLEPGNAYRQLTRDVMVQTWGAEPPPALVNTFCRSRPLLLDRLEKQVDERLHLAVNTAEQAEALARFKSLYPDMRARVGKLPLFFFNPDVRIDSLNVNDGEPVVTHWGGWSLEPVGAGWSTSPAEMALLEAHVADAVQRFERLADIDQRDFCLAAWLFGLERVCNQENYLDAIEMLPEVITCAEAAAGNEVVAADQKVAGV